jgi:hypothetical protein
MDNCDDIDLINNLFAGAICTYNHKTNEKLKHQKFNFGPRNGYISIWDAIKYHNDNDKKNFKIISIDLTGSKLGEMLKDVPI